MEKKTVSFMRSLCMGQIEEDVILPFPTLSDSERETLQTVVGSVGQLMGSHEKDFRGWDEKAELPPEFINELKEFGLFGLVIPESDGGLGFGAGAYSRALQEIGKYDASVAVTVGAHSSIGMRGLLLFGTDEQKARYYGKLATGEMIAAFCLTEPGSGSDAASIKTTAVKDGDDWILNGSKIWITNGGIAEFFTVFAKTGGVDERGKMSAFIVTRDMPGVTTGPHEMKMGIRASDTASSSFNAVMCGTRLRGATYTSYAYRAKYGTNAIVCSSANSTRRPSDSSAASRSSTRPRPVSAMCLTDASSSISIVLKTKFVA